MGREELCQIDIIPPDKRDVSENAGNVLSAVNNNPQLAECNNDSIYSGALLGESLNLSPSTWT